ncbi:MAG: GIY-YIG nuclease family protein, partial [Lachnospiraceae bacterium]|nr:GIY-YIG nuclease family protein [Lachnospiraceae bacterium]
MYRITNREFHSSDYGNEKYLKNWPMLYILENGKEAYIGESTNVYERMNQHKANEEKVGFDTAHFIYSDEFNQSVTFDYESKLIQLFAADEKYTITN